MYNTLGMVKDHQRGAQKRAIKAVTELAKVEDGGGTEVGEEGKEEVRKEGVRKEEVREETVREEVPTRKLSTDIFYELSISTSCLGFPLLTDYFLSTSPEVFTAQV